VHLEQGYAFNSIRLNIFYIQDRTQVSSSFAQFSLLANTNTKPVMNRYVLLAIATFALLSFSATSNARELLQAPVEVSYCGVAFAPTPLFFLANPRKCLRQAAGTLRVVYSYPFFRDVLLHREATSLMNAVDFSLETNGYAA